MAFLQMEDPPAAAPRPWLSRWPWLVAAYVAGWSLFALLNAGQHYAAMVWKDPNARYSMTLRAAFTDWGAWAALAPIIYLLCRRIPLLEPGRRVQALAAHLLLGPTFAALQLAVHLLIDIPVEWALGMTFSPLEHARLLAPKTAFNALFTYGAIAAGAHVIHYVRAARREKVRALELEKHLSDARLQVLQMQLQPHFLFNALNSISALMHSDVDSADRMLARLSELLRISLDTAGVQEVPLREELRHLQPYLEIESRRFGDRLNVVVEAAPDALEGQVPSLLLQPLVENSIRHGIARRSGPGRIEVRARRPSAQTLELTVSDDGPGVQDGEMRGLGVGLSNTQARLEQLYGASHRLQFGNAPAGGFEVTVTLPYRQGGPDGRSHPRVDRR